MRKVTAVCLMMLLAMTLMVTPVFAAEVPATDVDIVEPGTTQVFVGDDGAIVEVTVFEISDTEMEAAHNGTLRQTRARTDLVYGWRGLTVGYAAVLARTLPTNSFNNASVIECFNYGDNQGNGAITYYCNGVVIAVNAGTGCQFRVISSAGIYPVSASANWYNASYLLRITQITT